MAERKISELGEVSSHNPTDVIPLVSGGSTVKMQFNNIGLAASQMTVSSTDISGVLTGSTNVQNSLARLDATGVGATITTFTGNFTAQTSNIDTWFGGRQQNRLRCTSNAGSVPVTFTLPGTTDLTTAFDELATAGVPEVLRFIIEYTGTSTTFLQIVPASTSDPQIQGTSSVVVRSGSTAQIEITRSGGVISSYQFQSISAIGDTAGGTLNAIKLISPTTEVWDASTNGPLPSAGVVQGNAYRIVNAPTDGSGRFSKVMFNGDYAVWSASSFTAWSDTGNWFVLPATDVRRITALEQDFLTDVEVSPVSDRNNVVRGANYADSAGEIRLKIYANRAAYSAADLNTTGDIDEYTNASDITGVLGIRLSGNLATLVDVLPTLYVYSEDSNGVFTRLFNLQDDFTHEGDFAGESDYLSHETVNYQVGDTIRIYIGSVDDRYRNPNLDILESNLTHSMQLKLNREDAASREEIERINANEAKIDTLYPLAPDVGILEGLSGLFDPERTLSSVEEASGNSLFIDYRGDATRYESTGITYDNTGTDLVRYTGLGNNNIRAFGFKVSGPSDQTLMWVFDGAERIPYIDITAAGQLRVNDYTPARDVDERRNPGGFTGGGEGFGPQPYGEDITSTGVGSTTLIPGDSSSEIRFPIPNFPATSTLRERTIFIEYDVTSTNGATAQIVNQANIPLPDENVASAEQFLEINSFFLGDGNFTIVVGYEIFVASNQLQIQFRIVRASSNVASVSIPVARLFRAYTVTVAEPRVDNFRALETSGGAFNFTGEHEFLFSFQPSATQGVHVLHAVGLITATGQIDLFLSLQVHEISAEFATVEIPDQTGFANFEFRSWLPDHGLSRRNIEDLIGRRTVKWDYGLARLFSVTEHAFSEAIDFQQGIVLISPNSTRYLVTVDNAGALKTEVIT